jgi:hypothetical protein
MLVVRPTASEEPPRSRGLSHGQRHPGPDQHGVCAAAEQRFEPGPKVPHLSQCGLDDLWCASQVATHLIRSVGRQGGQNLTRIGSGNV